MLTNIDQALAQQIVDTVKDACGQNINFINPNGIIIASTDEKRIGGYHEIGRKAAHTGEAIEVEQDDSFIGTLRGINLPIYYNHNLIAVIGISGDPDEVRKYAHLAERVTHLLIRERELNAFNRSQEEKKQFAIHALISGEPTNPAYLAECLKEFHMDSPGAKRVILLRADEKYNPVNLPMLDQKVENLFSMMSLELYAFDYPNEYLAVLDGGMYRRTSHFLRKFAEDYGTILKVAVGKETPFHQLALSYRSARIAWKSIAAKDAGFASFDDLTWEIALLAMDEDTKEEFLSKTISSLEEKDLELLEAYLDGDMSLVYASKRLFLHKNTVQYKLNRIFEKTGLNPRRFRDAVPLYLALKLSRQERV